MLGDKNIMLKMQKSNQAKKRTYYIYRIRIIFVLLFIFIFDTFCNIFQLKPCHWVQRKTAHNNGSGNKASLVWPRLTENIYSLPDSQLSVSSLRASADCLQNRFGSDDEHSNILGISHLSVILASRNQSLCSQRESLINLYSNMNSSCIVQPYAPHLRETIKRFTVLHGRHKMASLSRRLTTLTVLITDGGDETDLLDSFRYISAQFKHILIVRLDEPLPRADIDFDILMDSLRKQRTNVKIISSSVEQSLQLSYEASNLFLHNGELSALAALVTTGHVMYTSSFKKYVSNHAYRAALFNASTAIPVEPRHVHGSIHPTDQIRALNAFRTSPSCCLFDYMGNKAEEKLVCSNVNNFGKEPCWIMSIGCRGKFEFEEAAWHRTNCKIEVFDCTGSWPIPDHLRGRVTLHKLCLGLYEDKNKDYLPLRRLIEVGMESTGFNIIPSFSKIDAEGYEFGALLELVQRDVAFMPDQLAVEVHMIHGHKLFPYQPTVLPNGRPVHVITESIALQFLSNMSSAGYELVNRVDNIPCPAICSEVSWVKRSKLPSE